MMKKTVLITAGAKRIGRYLVNYFAERNYRVIFTYNSFLPDATILQNKYDNIRAYQLDLMNEIEIDNFWDNLDVKVDILINNAALFERDALGGDISKSLNKHLTINLIAPMLMIKRFKQQKSSTECIVINILDKWASTNPNKFLSYSTSKIALLNFTKYMISNLRMNNIKVFGIELGFILYNRKFPKQFFIDNKDSYPSKVSTLLSAIDFIISNDSIQGTIIDLTSWEPSF